MPPDISGYLWRPVLAGLWRHYEIVNDMYDVHDLIEVNRVLDVRDENQRRADKAAAPKERK